MRGTKKEIDLPNGLEPRPGEPSLYHVNPDVQEMNVYYYMTLNFEVFVCSIIIVKVGEDMSLSRDQLLFLNWDIIDM